MEIKDKKIIIDFDELEDYTDSSSYLSESTNYRISFKVVVKEKDFKKTILTLNIEKAREELERANEDIKKLEKDLEMLP